MNTTMNDLSTPQTILVSGVLAVAAVGSVWFLIEQLRGTISEEEMDRNQEHRSAGAFDPRGQPDGSAGALTEWTRWAWRGDDGLSAVSAIRWIVAVALGVLVWWVTGWPVAAVTCLAGVVVWPVIVGGRRTERQQIEVLDAVVVWTQGLRDTVAGGASLEQAIGVSVEGAPTVLRPALEQVRSRTLVRQPLDQALEALEEVPGADFVTAALRLAALRRGDRLPDVLSGIVATCAEEVSQRQQILAGRAGIHRSVQIIIAMSVAILVWMSTLGATYMSPYDSLLGQAVLAGGLAVVVAGFAWLATLDTAATSPRFTGVQLTPAHERVVAGLGHTRDTGYLGGAQFPPRPREHPRPRDRGNGGGRGDR